MYIHVCTLFIAEEQYYYIDGLIQEGSYKYGSPRTKRFPSVKLLNNCILPGVFLVLVTYLNNGIITSYVLDIRMYVQTYLASIGLEL